MKGIVKNVIANRNFGFIRANFNNIEYFFHREDFNGHWDDLVADLNRKERIEVEFEETKSWKGPRASEVRRLDFPNQ